MTQSEVRYDLSFFDFPDFDECPFANETFFDSSPTSVEPFADALTCHFERESKLKAEDKKLNPLLQKKPPKNVSDTRTPTESSTVSVLSLSSIRPVLSKPNSKRNRRKKRGSTLPRWGATGLRSKIQHKFVQLAEEERHFFSNNVSEREAFEELRHLIDGLIDAFQRNDFHRCHWILTYLLHSRHLIRPALLGRRCGPLIVALTYSEDQRISTCAKTLLELWRFGARDVRRLKSEKEMELNTRV